MYFIIILNLSHMVSMAQTTEMNLGLPEGTILGTPPRVVGAKLYVVR